MLCVAVDAIVVGSETLRQYLATKRTWKGKLVLLTDGESPIQVEKWELIAKKVKALNYQLTIVYVCPISLWQGTLILLSGVDFDDDESDFHEAGKSHIKVETI
jgi:ATP-dependent DNA helicase 2 subunit 2